MFPMNSPGTSPRQVSLLALLDRYGLAHRGELETLWAAPGTDALVLFSDTSGAERAILPVGPAHDYRTTDEAYRLHIDGLRAVCHTPAVEAGLRARDIHARETWRLWHEKYPELISRVTAPEDAVGAALALVSDKLKELAAREAELAAMEHRLDTMAHDHLVRLAELEQRQIESDRAKREAERTGKTPRPFDRTPRTGIDLPLSFKPTHP